MLTASSESIPANAPGGAFALRLRGWTLPVHTYLNEKPTERPLASLKIDGYSAWEAAAAANHPILLTFVLSGFDLNLTDEDGVGASALGKKSSVNGSTMGYTLLHYAVASGKEPVVRLLLDCGADVNGVSPTSAAAASSRQPQKSPLMIALEVGNADICALLLERGANPLLLDKSGNPFIFAAVRNPIVLHAMATKANLQLSKLLTDRGDTLLHIAAELKGTRGTVFYLIEEANIDVDAKNKFGETPLHYACRAGADEDVVKALLSKGANVLSPRQQDGATPLHMPTTFSSLLRKYHAEGSNTHKNALLLPDASNMSALTDPKQWPANLAALILPNLFMLIGSFLPTFFAFVCLGLTGFGFTYVAKFCLKQKDRHLATAGWYAGALVTGSLVLVTKIFPTFRAMNPYAAPLIAAWCVLTLVMFTCYIRACLCDPGAIFSRLQWRNDIFESVGKYGTAEAEIKHFDLTTLVVKPPRSKHCSKTHQTVARFDHFCVWTGNAIGGGNHRPFVWFCMLQLVSQSFVMFATIRTMFWYKLEPLGPYAVPHGWCNWMAFLFDSENTLVTTFLIMYNSFVLLFCSAIVTTQAWYATRNVTSNEVWFADRYKWMFMIGSRAHSLYDRGCWSNVKEFFVSGDLTTPNLDIPTMNDYLTTKLRQYHARIKSKGGEPSSCGHDHGEGGSHGHDHGSHAHGGEELMPGQQPTPQVPEFLSQMTTAAAAAAAATRPGGVTSTFQAMTAMLPADTQSEIKVMQDAVQDLMAGRQPSFPSSWTSERQAEKLLSAKSMQAQLVQAQVMLEQMKAAGGP